MPVEALIAIWLLSGIGLFVLFAALLSDELTLDCKTFSIIVPIACVFFVSSLFWYNTANLEKQVKTTCLLKPVTLKSPDGIERQVVINHGAIINISHMFGCFVSDKQMIKYTDYEQCYGGIYYSVHPDYSIVPAE